MAHLIRIISDSKLVRGYVPTGADMAGIDQNTYLGINGASGGTWVPSSHIDIAGAGIVCGGPWSASGTNIVLTGPFTFGKKTADDYWQIPGGHPGRAYTSITPFFESWTLLPADLGPGSSFNFGSAYVMNGAITGVGLQGKRFAVPLIVYNGATFTGGVFRFSVGESHGPPQTLPKFRIVRMDQDGVVTPLCAASSTVDTEGFAIFSPTPVDAAAWYNGGAAKTFTYTCNQNNIIDTSRYAYYAEIQEEGGTSSFAVSGNHYKSFIGTFDTILLLDGRA